MISNLVIVHRFGLPVSLLLYAAITLVTFSKALQWILFTGNVLLGGFTEWWPHPGHSL